ncbi:MAG: hypothetical protein JNK85_14390 [Verrucomicrobiales bacterium]|nr:hypothetical protein [Verrucomicrobiales bacterium]
MIRCTPILRPLLGCLLGVGLLWTSSAPLLAQPNLLKDGSFEAGVAPGGIQELGLPGYQSWKFLPRGEKAGIVGLPNDKEIGAPPFAGPNAFFLTEAGMSQSFPTVAGRQYQVSLHANGVLSRPGTVALRVYESAKPARTNLAADFSSVGGGTWTHREFLFTASGTNSTLEIVSGADSTVLLDEVAVSLPRSEFTVFGTEERPLTTDKTADDSVIVETISPTLVPFNHAQRQLRSFSLVSSGTLIINANSPILLRTHGFDDIGEVTLMAETIIIRSEWRLKQTHVTIRARKLQFEGAGQIITTPAEGVTPPIHATGPEGGSNGTQGAPAGSVDLYVENFADAGGGPPVRFILTGGKGQDAGRGRHGPNGTSVPYINTHTTTSDVYPTVSYTASGGYLITYVTYSGFRGNYTSWGSPVLPTSGGDAWKSGTPGTGGAGGTLTTSVAISGGVKAAVEGGSPGARGIPAAYRPGGTETPHTSTTVCEGGAAGTPRLAEWVLKSEGFLAQVQYDSLSKFPTTVDGKSYPVPSGNPGPNGQNRVVPARFAWVHPVLLRKILGDIRRDYLANRIDQVRARLGEYVGILELFKADAAAWGQLEETQRLELGQMRDEMRLLLQQASHGLDYFGNPAGWVPMLSLEFSSTLFRQEIDRSLDIIYLARWIGTRQANAASTTDALETARKKLTEEITEAQRKYAAASSNLATFKSKAMEINERLVNLENKLRVKEVGLTNKAFANTQPPEWETGLRLSLKIVGVGAKMIPAYQPALGAVGDGLNLGSEFDPEQPWDSISKIPDIATTYLNAKAEKLAADQEEKLSTASMNPQELAAHNAHASRMSRLQDLSNASGQLSDGMKGISDLLQRAKVSSPKLEAELEKLKAADPEYISLADEIKQLLEDKRVFTDNIIDSINEVAGLSDTITRNLLAIDSLNTQTGESLKILDQRVQSYLKDMEQRAWDRLLKYHYYMAKAYEYRLVTPYVEPLDLSETYKKVAEIADASRNNGTKGVLSSNPEDLDRKALHGIFTDVIANTTQKIVDRFQVDSYEREQSVNVHLSTAEIAALNRGEAISLNLVNQKYLPNNEEDIRIRNIYLFDVRNIGTEGVPVGTSFVQLNIEHSGLSNIRKNGSIHQFRHYNRDTRSRITWRPRVTLDALFGPTIAEPGLLKQLSAQESLVLSLAENTHSSGMLVYSSPAAWADLKIWREVLYNGNPFRLGDSNAPITLTNVTLRVEYDYIRKPDSHESVEVLFAQRDDRTSTSSEDEKNALAPEVLVSEPDLNGRKNAVGRFVRIYGKSTTPQVTVTVPDRIGALEFWKWTDNGVTVTNSTPALTVATAKSHRLVAHYTTVYPASYRQTFDGINPADGVLDGSVLISNTGVARVVPGPDGSSMLKLTDLAVGSTRSQWVMQRLRPSVYGFVANFDYQVLLPANNIPADGFGFYVKPAAEPVDGAATQVGGYTRGLGVDFISFNAPGYFIRVHDSVLPQKYNVSPAADGLRHRVQIRYRTAPGLTDGVISVLLDGNLILKDVVVPFVPAKDDVFAFTGQTGGFTQTTLIDNIQITPLESPLLVNEVNDAPTFSIGPDQTVNSSSGPQVVEGWATAISTGPADESAQTLVFLTSVDQPALFAAAPAIDPTGDLTYTPAAQANGTAVITVQLKDNGGTADGGVDTSAVQTFRITVVTAAPTDPNEPPSFTKGPDLTVNSTSGPRTLNGWASEIRSGPATESAQTVVFLISVDQPELFAELPVIDATGTLTYTPAAQANGMAVVTVRLKDDGGTANGGVDTSPAQTFHITIATPVTADFLVTNTDDSGPGSLRQALTDAATKPGMDRVLFTPGLPGPIQLATVIEIADADGVSVDASREPAAVTLSGGKAHRLFKILTDSKVEFRRLKLTDGAVGGGHPDGYGGAVYVEGELTLIECSLSGNSASVGGAVALANNGTSRLAAERCTFSGNTAEHGGAIQAEGRVSATFSTFAGNSASVMGGAISGAFGYEVKLTHCTVSTNSAAQQGGGIIGENVNLQYSIVAGNSSPLDANVSGVPILSGPSLTSGDPQLAALADNGGPTLTMALLNGGPARDAATDSGAITDQRGLPMNGVPDLGAFEAQPNINDAPSFTKGSDPTVDSGSGPQTVNGWATAISAGPADESAQTLEFLISVDRPELFATTPAIQPTGTLTFTPAAQTNGTAVVTVQLKDNGGRAEGGVDTSAAQTFQITVMPPVVMEINDPPSFVVGPDQTVNSASGPRTFNGWATAINAGPADESAQTLVFLVSVDQPSLFAVAPAIDPTGSLTYTPAAQVNGTAVVTVRLKDNGGTADGGVDTSPAQTFVISIVTSVASEFVVTSANDSGPGSLRQALADAAAKPGADRITFAPGFKGPIPLATFIDIEDADGVSIDASSEPGGVTLSGGNAHRLFRIAAGSKVELRRLRLTEGLVVGNYPEGYGGAVFVEGQLTLVECSLTGNTAFAGGAAGIASNGSASLTAERCTFAGNSADHGGAVQVEGILTALSSTFTGNSAKIAGGAISAPFGHEVKLTHCTVSANSSGQQGGGLYGDNVSLLYCVVAGNTSPVDANISGVPTLSGTNLTVGDPQLAALADNGGPTSTMALLTGSPARNAATGSSATTDQRGRPMNGVPDLGAFESQPVVNQAPSFAVGPDQTVNSSSGPQTVNGWATAISAGPADESTQTLTFLVTMDQASLFAAVPSIDPSGRLTYTPAANANGTAVVTVRLKDNGGTADGGVDTSPAQTFRITLLTPVTSDFVVANANDAGPGSLRQALADAATKPGANRISFASGFQGPIRLATAIDIEDADGVSIDATSEPAGVLLSGGNAHRLFRIVAGSKVEFRRLRLTEGLVGGSYPDGYGGAVFVEGELTLIECSLTGNTAFAGGAIGLASNGSASLTAERCTFARNKADHGGAVQVEGVLTASSSTFAENSANLVGGAISAPFGHEVKLTHCTVSANTAGQQGGGVYGDNVSLRYCIVAGNTSAADANVSGVPILSGVNLTSGDPQLASLADNGGPTPTMGLLVGSPARDAATGSGVTADQRDLPMNGVPDLGAFESQPGNPESPVLSIQHSGANLLVSWDRAEGFVLEQTSDLRAGGTWSVVPHTTLGNSSSAVMNIGPGNFGFFRLRQR